MDILKIIKNRCAIRKYKDKPIPKKILNKIIEAGRWGPSLLAPGFQPWKFVVITNKNIIRKVGSILLKKVKSVGVGGNIVLHSTAKTVSNAKVIILVYNTSTVLNAVRRFRKSYAKLAKTAELCAISAAIQNMILLAESLGIGSCWLDSPLFCENKINRLSKADKEKLIAILTFGYPAEKSRRSPRKPYSEAIKSI